MNLQLVSNQDKIGEVMIAMHWSPFFNDSYREDAALMATFITLGYVHAADVNFNLTTAENLNAGGEFVSLSLDMNGFDFSVGIKRSSELDNEYSTLFFVGGSKDETQLLKEGFAAAIGLEFDTGLIVTQEYNGNDLYYTAVHMPVPVTDYLKQMTYDAWITAREEALQPGVNNVV